ncbi:EI24 domain-containing protein [Aliiroseovarius sp. YM-037]|uniref:EI24 domain-containing protein n=1 Tax=Aliiroseovarius sp. YM-037 TaxID=3341728 RepID=UPI003A805F72
MFNDFAKALGQLDDPRFRRVLALGVGLTLALLFAVYAALLGVVNWFTPDEITLPWVGTVEWVDDLLSWGSILFMTVLSMFLMVPVASAFTGFFLEDVAQAVEDRHYPHLPPAPRIAFTESLQDSLNFLALMVIANLLALVVYFLVNIFSPVVFWALNGFLLGREYFQLVAMRRLGRAGAKALRRKHGLAIWVAGILMAMPLTIPIVNLLVPVLGAATFTHLFHRLQAEAA